MTRITFKTRALVIGAVATTMLLAFVGGAQADHLPYVPAYSECYNAHVVTRAPTMSPLPQTGSSLSFGNVQVVKFRPHLAQYFPDRGWQVIDSGIWKKGVANSFEYGARSWTAENGVPVDGSHTFSIPRVGTYNAKIYYATFNEYRWVQDATHAGASFSDWNPHHENRGSAWNQKSYPWCEYPGPNEMVIG